MREILDGKSKSCRSCSSRNRMQALSEDVRRALAKNASDAALRSLPERLAKDRLVATYGRDAVRNVRSIGVGAKSRCQNRNDSAYANYGGRGIEFRFSSVRGFAEWVLDNLGSRPSPEHSLDRIDNNRHYEPGNLRWATRTEQARNKRQYKRTERGERIRRLQALRPDLTYETLRVWVLQGLSDDDITQRIKHAGCGVRHKKLRA